MPQPKQPSNPPSKYRQLLLTNPDQTVDLPIHKWQFNNGIVVVDECTVLSREVEEMFRSSGPRRLLDTV